MNEPKKYYGKYRGTVINNIDPLQIGRIMATVTDVSNLVPTSWALPCLPIAGKQSGVYMIPQIGAGVWIEFEQGNPDKPIWTGCYWGVVAEVPVLALAGLPVSPNIVLQTTGQNAVVVSDLPGPAGGILLKTKTSMIQISDGSIIITNGAASITMIGPTVNINAGALTII
jgi:uncharacterized protein involved in type VI secretion and phage assembly